MSRQPARDGTWSKHTQRRGAEGPRNTSKTPALEDDEDQLWKMRNTSSENETHQLKKTRNSSSRSRETPALENENHQLKKTRDTSSGR
jgi:hypothetical protein